MRKLDSFLTSKWNRMRSLSLLCALVAFSYSGLSAEVRDFETGSSLGPLGVEITSQPSGATICEGENTSFTVTASGISPTYAWQVSTNGGSSWSTVTNGGVYSNATTATLNITGAPAGMNNYRYRCIAETTGTATSDAAILTVNGATNIVTTSGPASACEGDYAEFSITATSATTYTWEVDMNDGSGYNAVADGYTPEGTEYEGASTNQLEISSPTVSMSGYNYRCVVSGDCTPNAISGVLTLSVAPLIIYYEDFDGDGYGNGWAALTACGSAPVGYSLTSDDCDDYNPGVHPGAVEICYDGIDNNCDGIVNEGCTQLDASYCGVTIEYLNTQYISAEPVAGAEQYEFMIINGAYVATATDDLQAGKVRFLQFAGYEYNTTYQVAARAKVDGVWGTFGYECSVLTTPAPHSELDPAQCGTTLPAMNTYIYTSAVNGATQYRFRVINGADVQIIDRPVRNFNMAMLASYEYNTTYTIDVAVEFNGSWWPYSASCSITTPSLSSSSIVPSQCGTTLGVASANVNATPVAGATQYRFRVANGADVYTVDKSTPAFKFTELPVYSFLTTYTVDVSVEYGGIFQPYGSACSITTPAVPTTQIQPSQCGISLPSMTTFFYATSVSGATSYRFRITEGVTAQTIDNATRAVNITMFPVYKANTNYSVEVAALVNGTWGAFGSVCNITTPAVLTQVKASQCGTTLSKVDKAIYADAVTNATQYRFRVTNGASVQTIDRTVPSFVLSQLASYDYATDYMIDVAVQYGGVWQPYGSACTISTPVGGSVTTTLAAASCGVSVSSNGQSLVADKVVGATHYEFVVQNAGLFYGQGVMNNTFTFALSQLTGIANSTTYTVKVRTRVNNIWSPYGTACSVTSAGSGLRPESEETGSVSSEAGIASASATEFDAVIFPNPFGGEFGVNVSTSSDEMVNLAVYDMTGKLMSSHSLSPQELGALKIGADFAAGIYQVKVVQGTDVKTLKVVKQ